MNAAGKRRRAAYFPPQELRARILKVRRRYFITRSEDYEKPFIDDEGEIQIEAVIEDVSGKHRKHLGEAISVTLLSARRYAPEDKAPATFFGSVTLRGSQRSVLAYLPSRPFWNVPALISDGAELLELTFTPMRRGFVDLLSVHVTDEPTMIST